jgi:hypothetical protein
MGIDRQQWTSRTPAPNGLRARIEQVAELVEPVPLPPPVEQPELEPDVVEAQEPAPAAPDEQPAGSGILAAVPHWRTNPAAFASRLEAPADDGDAGEPADPSADVA